MASPFSFFRKNQRLWMAGVVLLAVVAFVVLPAFEQLTGSGQMGNSPTTLVTWKGGRLNSNQLERLNAVHAQTYSIFLRLANEVVRSGGRPKVPGFAMTEQGMQIGLEAPQGPEGVVQVKVLSEAAKKQGVVVDDVTVDLFIRNFTDGKISRERFEEVVREVAGRGLKRNEMYDYLKDEIAKQIFVQMGSAGIASESQGLVVPSQNWLNFRKFQQRAKIEAYPVFVDEFKDKVTTKPSESELRALYNTGKDQFSVPGRAEPGFRQRYKANIEFLQAEFNRFLKESEEAVTPEYLQSEYENRVQDGRYRVPVASAGTDDSTSQTETSNVDEDLEFQPLGEDAETPVEPDSQSASESLTPESTSEPDASLNLDLPELPEVELPVEAPADSSSRRIVSNANFQLVSFLQVEEETQVDQEQAVEVDQLGEEFENAAADDLDEAGSEEATNSEESNPEASSPEEQTRIQTLDEVREELIRELALGPAQIRIQEAVDNARRELMDYTGRLQMYESQPRNQKTMEEPVRPDLRQIADKYGLTYGQTGLIDIVAANELPIGRSFVNLGDMVSRGMNFATFGEAVLDERSPLRLLQVESSQNFLDGGSTYLFWKTEDVQPRTPSFDEVREQVLETWTLQQARKLATESAEKIANQVQVSSEGNPWLDILETQSQELVLAPAPFTWLQPMFTGNEGIQLSFVEGIDNVSNEFMEKVFATPVGQCAVAFNGPETICYVVRLIDRTPSNEELKTQFASAPLNRGVMSLGNQQSASLAGAWFQSVFESLNIDTTRLSEVLDR